MSGTTGGTARVVVLGASGFVGGAVADALEARGHAVERLHAPRLPHVTPDRAASFPGRDEAVAALAERLAGAAAVVNAAGDPDASSRDVPALVAANAALPGVVGAAAAAAGVPRVVHVSSAVVQGRRPVLDESDDFDAFSAYARSKALGERLVRRAGGDRVVVYRPPSVHAADRRVTRLIARIGGSPLSTVARPGTDPSPQALLGNVADAVAFLATTPQAPPPVVIHPWEGLTTTDVMEVLGGRTPRRLPRWLARALVTLARGAGAVVPAVAANARRVEMLWFGQAQATSWLTTAGWEPPLGRAAWTDLGRTVRDEDVEDDER